MKPTWVHNQKIGTNPAIKDFLMTLKTGLEKMIELEKAKLEEHVQAKNRMGGR